MPAAMNIMITVIIQKHTFIQAITVPLISLCTCQLEETENILLGSLTEYHLLSKYFIMTRESTYNIHSLSLVMI